MFSADHPYASMAQARAFLDQLPVSTADREQIAHRNAERLTLPGCGSSRLGMVQAFTTVCIGTCNCRFRFGAAMQERRLNYLGSSRPPLSPISVQKAKAALDPAGRTLAQLPGGLICEDCDRKTPRFGATS